MATTLLRRLQEVLTGAGLDRTALSVYVDNDAAVAAYRRAGFQAAG
ncbi:MAG: GNAT family N-acetyltransferase [Pseudonocardiaceae bacterium]